jgi:hypothetical protein
MKEKVVFFLDIVLVAMVSLAQSFSLLIFSGIKPNLALAVLVVMIFSEKEFWRYLILVLTSLICLNSSLFISKELAVFGLLMLSAFYFKKYLSENISLFSFLFTLVLTTLFYLLIDFGYVFNNFNSFILELFYNISLSLVFGFFRNLYGKE